MTSLLDGPLWYLPHLSCAALGMVTALAIIPILQKRTATIGFRVIGRTFHHTHKTPVSRLGGVALAAAFVAVTLIAFIWFPADESLTRRRYVIAFSSLGMFLLGLVDDLRPIGARKKLLGQLMISLAVCAFGINIEEFKNPFTGQIFQLGF